VPLILTIVTLFTLVLLLSTIAVEAPGSVVVGTLVELGYAYDLIFRTSGGLLLVVLVPLAAAYRWGWLPESTTPGRSRRRPSRVSVTGRGRAVDWRR
jgi:hypothetical protein